MITFKFYVDKSSSLRLRITNNRKKAELVLGVKMSQDILDDILLRKTKPENLRWRNLIAHYQTQLEDLRIGLIKDGYADSDPKVIAATAREILLGQVKEEKPKNLFIPFFKQCAEKKKNDSYRASCQYTIGKVEEFAGENLTFEDISLKWLRDFDEWLDNNGASQNTRAIHFKNIRTALNRAIDEELTTNYPFRRFKIKQQATRKRSLTAGELRKLINYEVQPYQEMYRDIFALMFMFCGINAIDLHSLKGITSDGRIEYRRAKTHKLYSIKVEPEALAIIEKHKGKNGLLCIFDRWKSHKDFIKNCNIALKSIGKMQRVGRGGKKIINPEWPELTTYWCRHTWATIAYNDLDIPKDVISQALGHSSGLDVTEVYLDRDRRKVDEANRRVIDWVLYGKR